MYIVQGLVRTSATFFLLQMLSIYANIHLSIWAFEHLCQYKNIIADWYWLILIDAESTLLMLMILIINDGADAETDAADADADADAYADDDADAEAVTPESYTGRSIPSSLGRSFLKKHVCFKKHQMRDYHKHFAQFFDILR